MLHFFRQQGSGTPILLLHGFMENNSMWMPLLPALKGRDVIVPDLPGHGSSPWDKSLLSMPFAVNELMKLMADLKVDNFHIVGHSMGGYIAMEMLAQHPEQVADLALFQSTPINDSAVRIAIRNRAISAVLENKKLYIRGMISGLFAPHRRMLHDADVEKLIAHAAEMHAETIASALAGMKDRKNHVETAKKYRNRVSLFTGSDDPRLILSEMLQEHEEIGYKMLMIAPECGHMAHIESPVWGQNFLKTWANDLS
ncbi:MAG: alpha/beta fold hydrolase [Flavobacteriales bacterium]|nr:alpha/beta fold hydrolase [Flavobacteriales bacterium]